MSHTDLIEYARGLDVELARLTARHVKPLAQAVKIARAGAHRRDLGATTAFDAYGGEAGGYDSAFHVVFEIAQHALQRAKVDRQVERQLARQHPEAAAALVALRRYMLRDAPDWPHAARIDYERNFLADALILTPPQLRHPRVEYWTSLLDVFPSHESDVVAKAWEYEVEDGATAREEGFAVGRRGDLGSERENRYAPGTFMHAKWIDGYRCGLRQAGAERRGTGARRYGAGDSGRNAPANA